MRTTSFPTLFLAIPLLCCSPARSQAARDFFNDSTVQQVHLDVDPNDWASLQANYEDDTYYHANFTWNGITAAIGIRSHGGGSRSPIKPNLDLNFAKYTKTATFLGISFVVAKANNEDPSNLREWISMKLFRRMGVPAPREAPAQLYVNGNLLGFYYLVEHEDATFLQRNFGESGGYLYEWESADNYDFANLGTDPSTYAQFLDLKTDQTQPDLQTFTNLVQVVSPPAGVALSDDAFIAAVSQYLDPKQFLIYGAIEQALAGSDSLIGGQLGMNNFYLYQFQGATTYYFIPWDKDLTFSDATRDILDGITTGPNINLLAARLYAIPQYRQIYLSTLVRAINLMGGTGGWGDQEITREYGVISSAATNDPNKQCLVTGVLIPCGNNDFEQGVQWLHTFLGDRPAIATSAALSDGYTAGATPPVAVESLSAFSDSTQPLSPGGLAALSGSGFGAAAQAQSAPFPRVLKSTYVAVDGVRAPLVTTGSGSIEFQVPADISLGMIGVVASTNGDMSSTFDSNIAAAGPVILAVTHADGTPVSSALGAVPGETLSIFATGLGAVNSDVPIGAVAPANPITTTLASPQAFINNTSMTVTFSGLAPGFIGLYQVNAIVPTPAASGTSPNFTLSDNGLASQMAAQPVDWRPDARISLAAPSIGSAAACLVTPARRDRQCPYASPACGLSLPPRQRSPD